jgi:hypothetical protein
MSKRSAMTSQPSRKRKKGGVSYSIVDVDSLAKQPSREDIRVWNVTRSETTGRISATRKNHRHLRTDHSKSLPEGQPPAVIAEDVSIPTEPEQDEGTSPKLVAKRKKGKNIKENDSVSTAPNLTKPHLTRHQTRMADWLKYRSIMLDELLRMDGLGDSAALGNCVSCGNVVGRYRCIDCLGGDMCCAECIVLLHRHLPLHRLQVRSQFRVSRARYTTNSL